MNIIQVTKENFDAAIEKKDILILVFMADWCLPCKEYAPVYETLSATKLDVSFGTVDSDVDKELGMYFQVKSIPTTIIIRDGYGVGMIEGLMDKAELEHVITAAQNLDMKEIAMAIEEEVKNQ